EFERHFLAGIAGGKVNLTKSPAANTPLDGVPFQRCGTAGIHELRPPDVVRRDGHVRGCVKAWRGEVHGRQRWLSVNRGRKSLTFSVCSQFAPKASILDASKNFLVPHPHARGRGQRGSKLRAKLSPSMREVGPSGWGPV